MSSHLRPHHSRTLTHLSVMFALALSACSKTPDHGALITGSSRGAPKMAEERKVYAKSLPDDEVAPVPSNAPAAPTTKADPLKRPPVTLTPFTPVTAPAVSTRVATPDPKLLKPFVPPVTPVQFPLPTFTAPVAPAVTTSVAPRFVPPTAPIKFAPPTTAPTLPKPPVKITPSAPTYVKPSTPSPSAPSTSSTPTSPLLSIPTNVFTFFVRGYGQSVGVYDNGRLEKPDAMPNSGEGFLKIFQERERGYGSLDLVSILENAAKEIHRDLPATELLQIGDISDKNGGSLGGHGSHQNGLDADIAYFNSERSVMSASGKSPGATGFARDYVDRKGKVSPSFDIEANWRFIQILVSTDRIDRIFADQYIKKTFCEYAVAQGKRAEWSETLRKIRHWPKHQDHMHVRLTCPSNSLKCKPIPQIPAGDGCDKLLDRAGGDRGGFLEMDGQFYSPSESNDEANGDPNDRGC